MTRSFSWTLASRVFVVALSAIFGILSARLLGPADKGLYTLITLIPAAVSTITLLGGPQLALIDTRAGATSVRLRALLGVSAAAALAAGAVVGAVTALAAGVDLALAVLAGTSAIALITTEFFAAVRQGEFRYRELALLRAAQVIVPGAMMVAGALLGGLIGAVGGFVAGTLVVGAWAAIGLLRLPATGDHTLPWRFLAMTTSSLTLLFLAYRADVFVLGVRSTTSEIGFYAVAVAVAELVLIPALALSVVRAPHAARGESLPERRDVALLLSIALAAGAAAALVSQPLIELVFGVSFGAAAAALVILLPGTSLLGVYRYIVSLEMARSHKVGVVVSAAIMLVVDLAFLLWLAGPLGAVGAAIAATAAYAAGLLSIGCHRLLRARRRATPVPSLG